MAESPLALLGILFQLLIAVGVVAALVVLTLRVRAWWEEYLAGARSPARYFPQAVILSLGVALAVGVLAWFLTIAIYALFFASHQIYADGEGIAMMFLGFFCGGLAALITLGIMLWRTVLRPWRRQQARAR
jgi:hypothetical protein